MPTEEFVMRGRTASGGTEVLNFGSKHGYGFKLIEFNLYPGNNIGSLHYDMSGTITAGKTAVSPADPDFSNEGLIGTTMYKSGDSAIYTNGDYTVVNDTFIITQNIILMVQEFQATGGPPINWQCKFKPVKLSDTAQANANLRQFHVFDE